MLETWKGCATIPARRKVYGDRRFKCMSAVSMRQQTDYFSDGLDVPLVDELEQYFRGRIKPRSVSHNLTNDLGFAPLSMVVKVATANGLPSRSSPTHRKGIRRSE